jgi:hypothetical protein
VTITSVLLKKRQSIKLNTKKIKAEIDNQIICFSKKELVPTNEFIVKRPAIEIGKTKEKVWRGCLIFKKKSLSILFPDFRFNPF